MTFLLNAQAAEHFQFQDAHTKRLPFWLLSLTLSAHRRDQKCSMWSRYTYIYKSDFRGQWLDLACISCHVCASEFYTGMNEHRQIFSVYGECRLQVQVLSQIVRVILMVCEKELPCCLHKAHDVCCFCQT